MVAGDFSDYDGSLHPDILNTICDMINEWYDDGNDVIRRNLFLSITHSVHLADGLVYQWTHSQPSGNPGTSLINSIYNSFVMRLVFYARERMAGQEGSFVHDRFNCLSI